MLFDPAKSCGRAIAGLTAFFASLNMCLGIAAQTYCRWRREYGGLKVDQTRRLKDLEKEHARLRKAVSNLTLDELIFKEAIEGKYDAPHVAD